MPNNVQTYVIHDSDPKQQRGAIRIKREDARYWNEKGYGVFQTVQEFHCKRRLEHLMHINAWAVDIDHGEKSQMLEKILHVGLIPSLVVETKKGYHVYWRAKDATQENWKSIVEFRLIPFYHADKKAKDLCRLLRVPGYLHLKNPSEPFLVKKIFEKKIGYSEAEMLSFYKDLETPKEQKRIHRSTMKTWPMEGGFWERVWNLNCEDALTRLSGTDHVGGEKYEFKQNTNGTRQIYVDGKSTSSWLDTEHRIGSLDKGGPTIAQWLNWFHKDYSKTIKILKEVFPECQDHQIKMF